MNRRKFFSLLSFLPFVPIAAKEVLAEPMVEGLAPGAVNDAACAMMVSTAAMKRAQEHRYPFNFPDLRGRI